MTVPQVFVRYISHSGVIIIQKGNWVTSVAPVDSGYLEFQGYQVHLQIWGRSQRSRSLPSATGLGIDHFLELRIQLSLKLFLNFQLSPWFGSPLCLPSGCRKWGLLNMRPAAFIMCLELVAMLLVEPVTLTLTNQWLLKQPPISHLLVAISSIHLEQQEVLLHLVYTF